MVLVAGAALVALGAASCARAPTSAAPPVAPAATASAPIGAPSPTPSASAQVASLTGAAGQPLWSRPGQRDDRTVPVGDAVAVLEGLTPTGSPSATPAARPTGRAATPRRLVVLAAATGKVRANHRAAGGLVRAQPYRGRPAAVIGVEGRSGGIDQAYDRTGRQVWKSPSADVGLFGDQGEYALRTGYRRPATGSNLVKVQQLMTLAGKQITSVGELESTKGAIALLHDDAMVVARGQGFTVVTVARSPRTLWSSTQVAAAGFGAPQPIAVLDGKLLVQWADAQRRHQLSLHDLTTGKAVWRSETMPGGVTPGAVVLDSGNHVAVAGSDGTGPTLGIDVQTGKIRWRLAGERNFRPVAAWHGRVYGASGETALAVDVLTGRATTLGTYVEVAGVTTDGVLVLHGPTGPATGSVWAYRPPTS
jgi:hypothetical protein